MNDINGKPTKHCLSKLQFTSITLGAFLLGTITEAQYKDAQYEKENRYYERLTIHTCVTKKECHIAEAIESFDNGGYPRYGVVEPNKCAKGDNICMDNNAAFAGKPIIIER